MKADQEQRRNRGEIMSNRNGKERGLGGLCFWLLGAAGTLVVIYFLGFALLMLLPGASRLAGQMGISNQMLEGFYDLVFRVLEEN